MADNQVDIPIVEQLRLLLDGLRNPATDRKAARRELLEMEDEIYKDGGKDAIPILRFLAAERGMGTDCTRIIKQMERVLRGVQPLREVKQGEGPPKKPRASGLPDGWQDPEGWKCAKTGVWRIFMAEDGELKESQITFAPLWICRRFRDADDGVHHMEVGWPGGSEVVDRGVALQARELAGLAAKGAPVSSGSARDIVRFLEASESMNSDILPVSTSIQRLGWTTDADGKRAWQTAEGPHMLRAEGGHQQTLRAMVQRGTWEDWKKTADEVVKHPIPALMLAAAIASATLEATGADPMVLDLSGVTSKGKSTALSFAASAWGNPGDQGGLLLAWSATLAAIEARAEFCQHVPVFLDDTKKCPVMHRSKIADVIYSWGQGKPRGAVKGTRIVAMWKSVLLSTGEAPAVLLAGEHSGARMRVLSIVGQPFTDGAPEVRLVEGMNSWGFAGPKAAEWVRLNWEKLPEWWKKSRDSAEKRLGPGSARLAGFVASVSMGVRALNDMGLAMPNEKIKELCDEAAKFALASADTPTDAFDRIVGWVTSNSGRITEQMGWEDKGAPPGGWIGRSLGKDGVAIAVAHLDAELKRMGYDPQEIIPRWFKAKKCSDGPVPTWWMKRTVRMYRLAVGSGWSVSGSAEPPEEAKEGSTLQESEEEREIPM